MAQKQVIFSQRIESVLQLTDAAHAIQSVTQSQRIVIMQCARSDLPCELTLEQRTPKGPIDVRVIGQNSTKVYKINQRAKLREQYAVL